MTVEAVEQKATHERTVYDSCWVPVTALQEQEDSITSRMRMRMQYTAHHESGVDRLTNFEYDVAWYQYLDAHPGDNRVRMVFTPKKADLAYVFAQGTYTVRV